MPHTLYGVCNGLPVGDHGAVHGDLQVKTLTDQTLQHLDLHLSHEPCPKLAQLLIPEDLQLGIFLFQLLQLRQHHPNIRPNGQVDAVAHHRRQHGIFRLSGSAQSGADGQGAGSQHGADLSRRHAVHLSKACAGVLAQLGDLLFQLLTVCILVA